MRTTAWARSGARPSRSGTRPAGSWAASVARARAAFDGLAGASTVITGAVVDAGGGEVRVLVDRGTRAYPAVGVGVRVVVLGSGAGYSDVAAAAILSTALGLWSDTAAALGGDDGDGLDETASMGTD